MYNGGADLYEDLAMKGFAGVQITVTYYQKGLYLGFDQHSVDIGSFNGILCDRYGNFIGRSNSVISLSDFMTPISGQPPENEKKYIIPFVRGNPIWYQTTMDGFAVGTDSYFGTSHVFQAANVIEQAERNTSLEEVFDPFIPQIMRFAIPFFELEQKNPDYFKTGPLVISFPAWFRWNKESGKLELQFLGMLHEIESGMEVINDPDHFLNLYWSKMTGEDYSSHV